MQSLWWWQSLGWARQVYSWDLPVLIVLHVDTYVQCRVQFVNRQFVNEYNKTVHSFICRPKYFSGMLDLHATTADGSVVWNTVDHWTRRMGRSKLPDRKFRDAEHTRD